MTTDYSAAARGPGLGQKGEAPDWGGRLGIRDLWTEVAPNLWVGGTADDDTVSSARPTILDGEHRRPADARVGPADFDSVCTLYAWAQPADWGVAEHRYGFMDGPLEPSEREELLDAARFVLRALGRGRRVLVRCQAGINRSTLVACMALSAHEGIEPAEALERVRSRRSRACLFNEHFEAFLTGGGWEL